MSAFRSRTRAITITAPAEAVHRFVSDPRNLPSWAPDVASRIREEDGRWLAETPRGESEIIVSASPEHGTLDVRGPGEPAPRWCSRVIPIGDTAEFTFTQFVHPAVAPAELEEQMEIVQDELEAVRDLCEDRGSAQPPLPCFMPHSLAH